MEFKQLQTMLALVNNDFSVSRTAQKLFLVQSAVSQQMIRLEQELEADIFVRKGKRLTGLTDFGEAVVKEASRALRAMNNIRSLAKDALNDAQGILRIGCTHTQARYMLPSVIRAFNRAYPGIELQIHQGNPRQLVTWAEHDEVDFSICTEELAQSGQLQSIPCYRWNRCLITPPGHPLLAKQAISLEDLCEYPIITYVLGFTGRKHFNERFASAGLKPDIVLSAADTDIIKAYVQDGLGIGVIAGMAYDASTDTQWGERDLSHLFGWETTRIAYQKNKLIRRFQQTFIELFLQRVNSDDSGRIQAVTPN
jgi:LysR family cys regulon transcriptional activator